MIIFNKDYNLSAGTTAGKPKPSTVVKTKVIKQKKTKKMLVSGQPASLTTESVKKLEELLHPKARKQ